MTKVERYMSGDEEFTGTKQEVLEYELRMSRSSFWISSFVKSQVESAVNFIFAIITSINK